ncbi:MAG TPA: ABC transporter substrate-binding protein [Candidatus Saccharimonadales bacterium]|nr:ABC transporter substrate-binding protein [Candidatus Saccharimonadales bacterium]
MDENQANNSNNMNGGTPVVPPAGQPPASLPSQSSDTGEPSPKPVVSSSGKMASKKMLLIVIVVAVVLVGGSAVAYMLLHKKKAAAPKTNATIDVASLQIQEAPELAKQVAAGTLPAVRSRIPTNPVLVNPVTSIGSYGGTWHMAALATGDQGSFYRTIGYENLVRWNSSWTSVIPNVAQSYNTNSNGTTYTFTLRRGMKWSDGQPFNADDIMFWYTDVLSNKDLTPSPNPAWEVNGKLVTVKKVDDYTVQFVFPTTNGLFLKTLAQVVGAEPTSYPAHYLKQFDMMQNPDSVKQMMAAGGFSSYKAFFESKFGTIGTPDNANRWMHPEVPTLNAWVLTSAYGSGAVLDAQRNPYYWKIDTAGHQLPYIDQVEWQLVKAKSDILNLASAGKIDMQDRSIGDFGGVSATQNKSVLTANEQSGGYTLYPTELSYMNNIVISPNLTDKNPVLRTFFDNLDARIGLSYAINRPLIIKNVYGGQGDPFQISPRPETPYYNPTLAKQYTEYDVAKANAELDKAGYSKKDAEGYRLSPDGQRIAFTVDWGNTSVLNELQADWKAVGIQVTIGNTTDRVAYYAKKSTNGLDMGTWDGDGGLDPLLDPRAYFPFSAESNYAIPWAYWYSDPTNPLAQEPPAYVKQQQQLYNQIIGTTDEKKQNDLMKQILTISQQQFYDMGVNLPANGFALVKNNFHNVPKGMPYAFTYPTPAPSNPAQYYISN